MKEKNFVFEMRKKQTTVTDVGSASKAAINASTALAFPETRNIPSTLRECARRYRTHTITTLGMGKGCDRKIVNNGIPKRDDPPVTRFFSFLMALLTLPFPPLDSSDAEFAIRNSTVFRSGIQSPRAPSSDGKERESERFSFIFFFRIPDVSDIRREFRELRRLMSNGTASLDFLICTVTPIGLFGSGVLLSSPVMSTAFDLDFAER